MSKIVKLSDCSAANNFSASFWDDVNATPANFHKTLSDSDYKTIALYATKIINEDSVGISFHLKNKIVRYLKFLFTDIAISELFSKKEENTCKIILQNIYCVVDKSCHIKTSEIKMFDILKKYSSIIKYKQTMSDFDFHKEDIEMARKYLTLLHEKEKIEKGFFSKDERIQANIVMLKVLETAKKERVKEIEFLEQKMKRLLEI